MFEAKIPKKLLSMYKIQFILNTPCLVPNDTTKEVDNNKFAALMERLVSVIPN